MAATAAALAAGAVLTVGGAAGAVPIRPIGANQTFIGEVDSPASSGVVHSIAVVCTTTSKTGHPAAGQSVEVEPAPATGGGFTGSKATRVLVTFPAPSVSSTDVVVLVAYGEQGTIPKSLELPCSGEGVVRFTPSPTSKTARPFLLHVTFRPSSAPSPTRASATR